MGKTNNKTHKPDTESIRLTYDELEVALVALSLRQEELRDARSQEHNAELETLWYIGDKMDYAQRSLESKMTHQVSEWLRTVDKDSAGFTKSTKHKRTAETNQGTPRQRLGVFARLSRITRL
jgi:hypothetical protein